MEDRAYRMACREIIRCEAGYLPQSAVRVFTDDAGLLAALARDLAKLPEGVRSNIKSRVGLLDEFSERQPIL